MFSCFHLTFFAPCKPEKDQCFQLGIGTFHQVLGRMMSTDIKIWHFGLIRLQRKSHKVYHFFSYLDVILWTNVSILNILKYDSMTMLVRIISLTDTKFLESYNTHFINQELPRLHNMRRKCTCQLVSNYHYVTMFSSMILDLLSVLGKVIQTSLCLKHTS